MSLKSGLAVIVTVISSDCGSYVSYPRLSIYTKPAHFSLKVNGTSMYTVNNTGYDYIQLSMDQGHGTEFRIAITDYPAITSYIISSHQIPISATVDDNELIFSVVDAHCLIIKINDEKEFVILADPTETYESSPTATGGKRIAHGSRV